MITEGLSYLVSTLKKVPGFDKKRKTDLFQSEYKLKLFDREKKIQPTPKTTNNLYLLQQTQHNYYHNIINLIKDMKQTSYRYQPEDLNVSLSTYCIQQNLINSLQYLIPQTSSWQIGLAL